MNGVFFRMRRAEKSAVCQDVLVRISEEKAVPDDKISVSRKSSKPVVRSDLDKLRPSMELSAEFRPIGPLDHLVNLNTGGSMPVAGAVCAPPGVGGPADHQNLVMDCPGQEVAFPSIPDSSVLSLRLEKLLATCERHANSKFISYAKEYLLAYKESIEAGRVPVTITRFVSDRSVSDRSVSTSSLYKYIGKLLSENGFVWRDVFLNDYANQARKTSMINYHLNNKAIRLEKNKYEAGPAGACDSDAIAIGEEAEQLSAEDIGRCQAELVATLVAQYVNDYLATLGAGGTPETQESFIKRNQLTGGAFRYALRKYLKENNLELRKVDGANSRSAPGRSDYIGLAYIESYRKSLESGLPPESVEEFAHKYRVSCQWVHSCVRKIVQEQFSDSGGKGKSSSALKGRHAPSWQALLKIYLDSSGKQCADEDSGTQHNFSHSGVLPDPQATSQVTLPVVKSETLELFAQDPSCLVLQQVYDDGLPVLRKPGSRDSVLASVEGDIEKIEATSWGLLFWDHEKYTEDEINKIKQHVVSQCRSLLKIDGTPEMAKYMDDLMQVLVPLEGDERGQSLFAKKALEPYTVLGFYSGELINPNETGGSKKDVGPVVTSYDFATMNKNTVLRGYGYECAKSNRLSLMNSSDWKVSFNYKRQLSDKSLSKSERRKINKQFDTDVRESVREANVITFNFGRNLTAFVTKKPILPGEELFVPYGPKYEYFIPPKKVRPSEVKLEAEERDLPPKNRSGEK